MTRVEREQQEASPVQNDQQGSASVELAILIPGLVLMLGLIICGGRIWFAKATVVEASNSAARAASLERTVGAARSSGQEAGQRALTTDGLRCSATSVEVDTSAFAVAVGNPATITASVGCTVKFSDLGLRFLPGTIRMVGSASAALDTYRAR